MNSKEIPSIIRMEKESLKQLITEVKETLATDINLDAEKGNENKFGVVDMWNSQRYVRTADSRRRYHTKAF